MPTESRVKQGPRLPLHFNSALYNVLFTLFHIPKIIYLSVYFELPYLVSNYLGNDFIFYHYNSLVALLYYIGGVEGRVSKCIILHNYSTNTP